MGGVYQEKKFKTIGELARYLEDQVEGANEVGLYLFYVEIRQLQGADGEFEYNAYFSK